MAAFAIRTGDSADYALIEAMLYEAFGWEPGAPRLPLETWRTNPEFAKWVEGFSEREGDTARIAASAQGEGLGAAWYRHWTADHHSYGFVAEEFPELAIGVVASARGRGIGRALLAELVRAAREAGRPGLSLSVDPANPARLLYESVGFRRVGESGTSWTLLLELDSRTTDAS